MPKILVADDNSNIQKMVGLALKDQGIDVVAVGNGEAAVRKISDVRPDLVLADVFMPVRNGYEVCKYVKEDSALSHIPVILLVGAFDPLDEQEAQRVGADGVLKKPFVPPDPLISMVKSALTRAGVGHPSGGNFAQESAPSPLRAADLLTPQPSPFPPPAPMPLTEPEPFHEPVSKKPEPFTIEPNTQPVAFGSLLETPGAQEEAVDDTAYVTPPSSPMVPERNWGADEVAEEAEEEDASSGGWRPLGGGDEIDEIPAGRKDWREQAFEAIESIKRDSGKWTPAKELPEEPQEVPAAVAAPEPVSSAPAVEETPPTPPWISRTPAAPGTVETPASDLASSSLVTEMATEAPMPPSPFVGDSSFMQESYHADVQEPVAQEQVPVEAAQAPAMEDASKAATQEWYSVPSSPWDAEAQKASQLASTWDAPAEPAHAEPAHVEEPSIVEQAGVAQEPVSSYMGSPEPELEMEIPAATEEIIRDEAVHAVEETVYDLPASRARTNSNEFPAEAGSANVEEIVARVLARMSPEVLQAVTREILKPVVEAIVRDELDRK